MGRAHEEDGPEKEQAPLGVMRRWGWSLPGWPGLFQAGHAGALGPGGGTRQCSRCLQVAAGWPVESGGRQELVAVMQTDQGGWVFQANLKKFMDYIQLHSTDKVARLLDKGLDPNFHDPDSGGEMQSKKGRSRGVAWT